MKKLIAISLLMFSSMVMAAWPTKPITLILPWSAGGWGDRLTREFQRDLERDLGVPVVVKPMPGAAFVVAINNMLGEENDNHTFMFVNNDFITSQYVLGTQQYEKFTPVSIWMSQPYFIYGGKGATVEKLKQQIANGETVSIGNIGANGSQDLWSKSLKTTLKINSVPYKGSGPMKVDVLGGHLEYGISALTGEQQLIDEGRLVPLVVSSNERHRLHKNAVPFNQVGFRGNPDEIFAGWVARKDASPEAIKGMSEAIQKIVKTNPQLQALQADGANMVNLNLDGTQKLWRATILNTEQYKIKK
jgi:tripartite-type tricarboxylate transporter receptor subunit TctC